MNFHQVLTGFTINFKPTLHLQVELDVALKTIIFELRIISFQKGDKNYGIELAACFTNKDKIYHDLKYTIKHSNIKLHMSRKIIFTVIL